MMLQCTMGREQRDIRLFLKNPVTDLGMRLHMLEFIFTKHPGLLNNFDRNLCLADVMQQRTESNDPQFFLAVAMGNAKHQCVEAYVQGMHIQIVVCGVHIQQHNHRIFLSRHIVQYGIHHFGEFLIQVVEAFGNSRSAGHLLKLISDYLERLISRLILQHSGNHDIFRDGILYIDIADIDPSEPLDQGISKLYSISEQNQSFIIINFLPSFIPA